jgi:hypothetical protein
MKKGRGHQEVFPGDIQVENFHQLEILQILLRNEGDGDIEDVQFVLLNKMEQQVKRPFKPLQPEGISGVFL